MEFNFKVTSLSKEELVDILSCADVGCSYWCDEWIYDKEVYKQTREKLKSQANNEPACFEDILADMLLNKHSITFHDCEDDEDYTKALTYDNLLKGVCDYMKYSKNIDMDTYDAGDFDNVIQYALFGEIIFG